MRKIIIAGNWKMHKTQAEAQGFLQEFKPLIEETEESREVVLCPPFTHLRDLSQQLHGGRIRLGAQNVHWEDSGAYTGEISAAMLAEIGIHYVVIGHSERRQHFGETDETANRGVVAAQKGGLIPILCVGESKAERDAGQAEKVIIEQVQKGLVNVDQGNLVIAYEPVWAIGTGHTCAATEANRVIGLIREQLDNPLVTIQYGGSVKADNVDEIMAQPEIDGALVGGASLDPIGFARIVNFQV